ncbi:MAG TPA: response regulator [Desulfobulbus sp.]|nr:response regulator [Desulfobulbus sp.]
MEPSILIVDDEQDLPEMIKDFLEDETDFKVRCVNSAEKGQELLPVLRPDICMVDMRLPGMDGNTFILQTIKQLPDCKFIIHTGSSEYTIPPELRKQGITPQSVLFKPVIGLHLYLNKINELLKA